MKVMQIVTQMEAAGAQEVAYQLHEACPARDMRRSYGSCT